MGYDTLEVEAVVQAILVDGCSVDEAKANDTVQILLNQTPFYAESGGQVGDKGSLNSLEGTHIQITDTQKKLGTLSIHCGKILSGNIKIGQSIKTHVDGVLRDKTRANHSATHLLHSALRKILGPHVTQKGSLVSPDRLRFDFTHTKPVSAEELKAVEQLVNQQIQYNFPVETHLMSPDEAVSKGAMALFGEKYGDMVRVVTIDKNYT